jgi:hypothetical protein
MMQIRAFALSGEGSSPAIISQRRQDMAMSVSCNLTTQVTA